MKQLASENPRPHFFSVIGMNKADASTQPSVTPQTTVSFSVKSKTDRAKHFQHFPRNQTEEKQNWRNLAVPGRRWGRTLPDSDGLVAATRSEQRAGGVPWQTPNPIGMAFEPLNFLEFQTLFREIHPKHNETAC